MANKTQPINLDAWFANTLGNAGNGVGKWLAVGMGTGDWAWQNRTGIRLARGTLFDGVPNADAITAFDLKFRVANKLFGIGGSVALYAERGTTTFTEYDVSKDPTVQNVDTYVSSAGPASGEWPGPTRDATNRGTYSGAPSADSWITVNLLALGKWWFANPTVTELNLVILAQDETATASRVVFYSRHTASAPYAQLTFNDEQAPNAPSDLTPEDTAKYATSSGEGVSISARMTHPEGKSATHHHVQWYPTTATDATPGTPLVDGVYTETTAHNAIRSHLFTRLTPRTAGKWRIRFGRNGLWGPWSPLRTATPVYLPAPPQQPYVTPGTLTPTFYGSLSSNDPADVIGHAQTIVYQDPATGSTIVKWDSGKTVSGGTRFELGPYGGTALAYGTKYRYVMRLWNRDDVASEWTGNLYFTPQEALGPNISPSDTSTKQNTKTPTFTLTDPGGGNIDQYRMWFKSPSGTLLHDTGAVAQTSALTASVVTPANLWDWGQEPLVEAAIRITGNANMGPTSDQKRIHINAAPGAPYPVSVLATNEVQRVTITGAPTGGTFTLTFEFAGDSRTTAAIAYNATAADVVAALEGLSNIDVGEVSGTGGPLPGTAVDVTFGGRYANTDLAQMTATSSLTGGTTPAVAVSTVTLGGSVIQQTDGTWVATAGNPTLRFPFRDADKDLGYAEAPTRREVEIRTLDDVHVAGSPFVITTGITDDHTATGFVLDTTYKARARYDDNAAVRSAFNDYLFVARRAAPGLSSVTPLDAVTITDPTPVIAWTLSRTQVSYRVTVTSGGDLIYDSGTVAASGTSGSHAIPADVLPNASTVAWTLEVFDTYGLRGWIRRTFTTSFTQPPALTGLVLTPDTDAKAMLISWTASALPAGEFDRYILRARAGSGQFRTVAEITDQATTSYLYRGAEYNTEFIVQVTQSNGWMESPPLEGTALLEFNTYDWLRPEPIDLHYVQPGGFSDEEPTRQEEFEPLGRNGTLVTTWDTGGRRWRLRIFVPPESLDVIEMLRADKKAGLVGIFKAPDGTSAYSVITGVGKTAESAGFYTTEVSGTETGPDSGSF